MKMQTSRMMIVLAGLLLGLRPAGGAEAGPAGTGKNHSYVLSASDVLEMRVYQEDDLSTKVRIAKDGTASFPLIGTVLLAGKTVEEAAVAIGKAFDKDYLVNPQVTLSVTEYAKRRFTVLGQVQKPDSYEIPNEESTDLLQAIAMAGGFTRLASPNKVVVSRVVNGENRNFTLDARALAQDGTSGTFQILPGDTITVGERFF